jgi:hypothetical protein
VGRQDFLKNYQVSQLDTRWLTKGWKNFVAKDQDRIALD